jgi:hypothetical protein
MKILFAEEAWEDYQQWLATDRKLLKRINLLIRDASGEADAGVDAAAERDFDCLEISGSLRAVLGTRAGSVFAEVEKGVEVAVAEGPADGRVG